MNIDTNLYQKSKIFIFLKWMYLKFLGDKFKLKNFKIWISNNYYKLYNLFNMTFFHVLKQVQGSKKKEIYLLLICNI